MNERFECILDPCNCYVVWDNVQETPLLHHGRILCYADYGQGQRIAAALNAASPPGLLNRAGSWLPTEAGPVAYR